MTPNVLPLDPKSALNHGFRRIENFRFAQAHTILPVQLSEISALVPTLPLAFARLAEDVFVLVAVMGFSDGRNLLVDDEGRWTARHLPNQYRAYPFSLQAAPGEEGKFMLCFDHASGLYRESPDSRLGEVRFFDDDGQLGPNLRDVTHQLMQNARGTHATRQAVTALAQQNLLVPWQLADSTESPTRSLPVGLYRIDEPAMARLTGNELEPLHKANALAVAYGQLLSMSRVSILQRLQEQHQKQAKRRAETIQPQALAQSLGDSLGETLRFDWIK